MDDAPLAVLTAFYFGSNRQYDRLQVSALLGKMLSERREGRKDVEGGRGRALWC